MAFEPPSHGGGFAWWLRKKHRHVAGVSLYETRAEELLCVFRKVCDGFHWRVCFVDLFEGGRALVELIVEEERVPDRSSIRRCWFCDEEQLSLESDRAFDAFCKGFANSGGENEIVYWKMVEDVFEDLFRDPDCCGCRGHDENVVCFSYMCCCVGSFQRIGRE